MKDTGQDTTALERRANEYKYTRDSSRMTGWRDQMGKKWEDGRGTKPGELRDESGWLIEPAPLTEVDADAMR